MDYQRFWKKLPTLYENWGEDGVCPKSECFQQILERVRGMTTANVMQLLNWAVACMEPEEIYCEIGCFQGASLIGALLENHEKMAYAVDNFSEFDPWENSYDKFLENLSKFGLENQAFFCHQHFEEFFSNLHEIKTGDKIGVYFYDGAHDYRSHLMGLLLVQPFLADKAVIIAPNSNWEAVRQATKDFIGVTKNCNLMEDLPFGDGVQVFIRNIDEETNSIDFTKRESNPSFITSVYEAQKEKNEIIKSLYKKALELDNSEKITIGLAAGKTYSPEWIQQVKSDLLQAEQKYKEVLQWDKNNVEVWLRLGNLYFATERYQESLQMLLKSLELDSSGAIGHYRLGLVFEKFGKIPQAIRAYQEAIALEPKFIDAYNNLGIVLFLAGEIEQAELVYRQAIAANPEHFRSYLNLGNLLMSRQEVEKAIASYKKALQLNPENPDILHNLGIAYQSTNNFTQASLYLGDALCYQEKYEEAIIEYQKILETKTGDIEFYINLAYCYRCLNRPEESIKVYQEGLLLYPRAVKLYKRLVEVLEQVGSTQEAIEVACKASQLLSNDLSLKLAKYLTLPIVYETQEEIHFYRGHFSQGLEELIQQTHLDTLEAKNNALLGISRHTNFLLQYQGKNDLELQKQYGQFVHRIMAANYPQWVEPRPMPPLGRDSKIRIGYISSNLKMHTVGKLFLGWLHNCDREKFEVYCYSTSRTIDQLTQQFRLYSSEFFQIPDENDLEAVCKKIVADQLHILVFLDIGMRPLLTQIAGLRLAPVQCSAWGHPITSGSPTIDYFLSSDLMEPENAQDHYCEQLIRLPNIGIAYSKPDSFEPTKTRADFQLRDDAVVYLSCQSLYKYLPQYDYIFAAIAQRVPQAQFVFIESRQSSNITDKFYRRLQHAFAKLGLNSEDYCVSVPGQTHVNYLSLNLAADIYLDTLGWSGGNTSLEAIACNLPIVTCPGEFMRGRHSYGILKMLGVTETIARNEKDYIDIAVRLGLDPQWRNSIVQQMKARHSYLYDDQSCVTALEEFYQHVVWERMPQVWCKTPNELRTQQTMKDSSPIPHSLLPTPFFQDRCDGKGEG